MICCMIVTAIAVQLWMGVKRIWKRFQRPGLTMTVLLIINVIVAGFIINHWEHLKHEVAVLTATFKTGNEPAGHSPSPVHGQSSDYEVSGH